LVQAYKAAIVSGISPTEFWELTPYQTRIASEAILERSDKQAWMIAMYTRAKKLPQYETLTRGAKKYRDGKELKAALQAQADRERRR
jgi:hypothetical protein